MVHETRVALIGPVPVVRAIREVGNAGLPIVASDTSHAENRGFRDITETPPAPRTSEGEAS